MINPKNGKKTRQKRKSVETVLRDTELAELETPEDLNYFIHIYPNKNECPFIFPVSIIRKFERFEIQTDYPKKVWFWAEVEYKGRKKPLRFCNAFFKRNKKHISFTGPDDLDFELRIINKLNDEFKLDFQINVYFPNGARIYDYLTED